MTTTNPPLESARRSRPIAITLLCILSACMDPSAPPTHEAGGALDAKGGGGKPAADVTVTAAMPDTGYQGATLDVTITGSGFTSDMDAIWELSGSADPSQVRTNSTRFVSSKQLVANITIAPDATPTKWDIRVQSRGTCCKGGVGLEMFEVAVDPRATWLLPLDDAGLALRSDGLYGSAGYSNYEDGVCGVIAKVFATTEASHSGDATFNTSSSPTGKKTTGCARKFTLAYPDGFAESLSTFANLRELQNTMFVIPVGESRRRKLAINLSVHQPAKASRCGRLDYGEERAENGGQVRGVGSDSVLVTRLDGRTWQVETTAGRHRASCQNTGTLVEMPVSFRIATARILPE